MSTTDSTDPPHSRSSPSPSSVVPGHIEATRPQEPNPNPESESESESEPTTTTVTEEASESESESSSFSSSSFSSSSFSSSEETDDSELSEESTVRRRRRRRSPVVSHAAAAVATTASSTATPATPTTTLTTTPGGPENGEEGETSGSGTGQSQHRHRHRNFLSRLFSGIGSSITRSHASIQKSYHNLIASTLTKFVQGAAAAGVGDLIHSETLSFENRLFRCFTYRFVGDYVVGGRKQATEPGGGFDEKHMAYFVAMLCKIAYEEPKNAVRHLRSFFLQGSIYNIEVYQEFASSSPRRYRHIGLYVFKVAFTDIIYVVFRGAHFFDPDNWKTDFDFEVIRPYPIVDPEKQQMEVHKGFYHALFLRGDAEPSSEIPATTQQQEEETEGEDRIVRDNRSLFEKVVDFLTPMIEQNPDLKVIAAGHSMAGAIASVFAISLETLPSSPFRVSHTFTFGSPKVGNKAFVDVMKDRTYRFINDLDIVPVVPEMLLPHGQEILVTKILPIFVQARMRGSLSLVGFSMLDHFPGHYVSNIAKLYGFVCGDRKWNRYLKKIRVEEATTVQAVRVQMQVMQEEMDELRSENDQLKTDVAHLFSIVEALLEAADDDSDEVVALRRRLFRRQRGSSLRTLQDADDEECVDRSSRPRRRRVRTPSSRRKSRRRRSRDSRRRRASSPPQRNRQSLRPSRRSRKTPQPSPSSIRTKRRAPSSIFSARKARVAADERETERGEFDRIPDGEEEE